MSRPTVLVATTDSAMAHALEMSLRGECVKLGLRLQVNPGADQTAGERSSGGLSTPSVYTCAEALLDELERRACADPIGLADTLVVLDVGARLDEAFDCAISGRDSGWHVTKARRAGIAVELVLRFPQVFPVILSLAVPTSSDLSSPSTQNPNGGGIDDEVARASEAQRESDIDVREWCQFRKLRSDYSTRHLRDGEKEGPELEAPTAWSGRLHFISPLEGGKNLLHPLKRFANGMRCWFDPTGLRTLVRNRFLGIVFGNDHDWSNTNTLGKLRQTLLERMDSVAMAIDEEREFAMVNAYMAYKFGFRAWMVSTYGDFAEHLLREPKVANAKADRGKALIILRDLDLRFPDVPEETEKSGNIREALRNITSEEWTPFVGTQKNYHSGIDRLGEGSKKTEVKVRVVSSHRDVISPRMGLSSEWCLEQRRLGQKAYPKNHFKYIGVRKPITSIYDVRPLLGVAQGEHSVLSRIGVMPDESESSQRAGNHGAPYLNLSMAESLLLQARPCGSGPAECLLGALLAGEAFSLLLGMSKTTALEALLLLHKQEAAAEVSFPGVDADLDIEPRKRDVEATVDSLYPDDDSADVKKRYLSQLWADLRPVYRYGERFSAAEEANAESLVNTFWWPAIFRLCERSSPAVSAKRWGIGAATKYRWLALSFIVVNLVAMCGYACILNYQADIFSSTAWANFARLFSDVMLSSLAAEPKGLVEQIYESPQAGLWKYSLLVSHLGLSLVMLGLFIAITYRKITRS